MRIFRCLLFPALQLVAAPARLPQSAVSGGAGHDAEGAQPAPGHRAGRVRVEKRSLVDAGGPFLASGVSYFTALQRCRTDRARLESDLGFLAGCGFDSFRMFSMVGHNASWAGLEIAPVTFTNEKGRRVEAWPYYWDQFRSLVDVAYDKFGMRTEITVFADAQLMPEKEARRAHLEKILTGVVAGREHKIILIELANEAWQNGFPGAEGVADLRDFGRFLNSRTEVPVALSSNHDWPGTTGTTGFDKLYSGGVADVATWHFSRDRKTGSGWLAVTDCWDYAVRPGMPPVCSNEPIGPGASVNTETAPVKLVLAPAFAWAAGLPMFVFHSEAGVHGRTRFEETPAIASLGALLRLLPPDLPSWTRRDGLSPEAVFTIFRGNQPDVYLDGEGGANDGCVRLAESRRDARFVSIPLGIPAGGLQVQARKEVEFSAHDPLTGTVLVSAKMKPGERLTLPSGPGALLLLGNVLEMPGR